jgi:hypothetical protein
MYHRETLGGGWYLISIGWEGIGVIRPLASVSYVGTLPEPEIIGIV